jgi:hypothetical protein
VWTTVSPAGSWGSSAKPETCCGTTRLPDPKCPHGAALRKFVEGGLTQWGCTLQGRHWWYS